MVRASINHEIEPPKEKIEESKSLSRKVVVVVVVAGTQGGLAAVAAVPC